MDRTPRAEAARVLRAPYLPDIGTTLRPMFRPHLPHVLGHEGFHIETSERFEAKSHGGDAAEGGGVSAQEVVRRRHGGIPARGVRGAPRAAGARVAVDDWAAARGGAAYEAGSGELAIVVSNAGSVLIVR